MVWACKQWKISERNEKQMYDIIAFFKYYIVSACQAGASGKPRKNTSNYRIFGTLSSRCLKRKWILTELFLKVKLVERNENGREKEEK